MKLKPIKKTQKEVVELVKNKPTLKKPTIFGEYIEELKKNDGGLVITPEMWEMKTPIPTYYNTKYNTKEKKVIKVEKVSEGYLITKL